MRSILELEAEVERLRAQVVELADDVERERAKGEMFEKGRNQAEAEVKRLRAELDGKLSELSEAEASIAVSTAERDSALDCMSEAEEKFRAAEAELERLRARNAELEEDAKLDAARREVCDIALDRVHGNRDDWTSNSCRLCEALLVLSRVSAAELAAELRRLEAADD